MYIRGILFLLSFRRITYTVINEPINKVFDFNYNFLTRWRFIMNFFKRFNKFFAFLLILSMCCSSHQYEVKASDPQCDLLQESCNTTEDKYSVDCIFSIGGECRPAAWLKKCGMRYQASPLDSMMGYSLDTVIKLFKTKFEDFFKEIEEIPDKFCCDCKFVRDKINKIISIHHFHRDSPLKVEHEKFREIMLRRAKKVDKILNESNTIGLICNRSNVTPAEFMKFVEEFREIYPNKKIVLINIVNADTKEMKKSILFKDDNSTIIQFTFLDKKHDEDNLPGWMGNAKEWQTVMDSIVLKGNNCNTDESAVS